MKKTIIERKTHTIDAEGRPMGRLSTEIALILRGKNKPSFEPHIDAGDFVNVTNVSKMKFTGKKMEQKVYKHHSGYIGGLKEIKLSKMFAEKPEEVLYDCVYHMLPKNKLRNVMIKRLKISN